MRPSIKILVVILSVCFNVVGQTGWYVRPQLESKMHIFGNAPFTFSDSLNTIFYKPENFLVTRNINFGGALTRNFKGIRISIGLFSDHSSFKFSIKVVEKRGNKSSTHTSTKTLRYYRLPLSLSILLFGNNDFKSDKHFYIKGLLSIGKEFRLAELNYLFVNLKKRGIILNKQIEKESLSQNNQLLVYESMEVRSPRYLANNIGVQFDIFKNNKELFSIGVSYSFYFKGRYLSTVTTVNFNNSKYYFFESSSGNAVYITLSKEIKIKDARSKKLKTD